VSAPGFLEIAEAFEQAAIQDGTTRGKRDFAMSCWPELLAVVETAKDVNDCWEADHTKERRLEDALEALDSKAREVAK